MNEIPEMPYERYAINAYYGPPIDADRVRGKKFSYMLTIPNALSREQMEAILRMVALFKKSNDPELNGIEYRTLLPFKWRDNTEV